MTQTNDDISTSLAIHVFLLNIQKSFNYIMARYFITGSSDGLGSLTAKALIKNGHSVVLHARNSQRAKDAAAACPGAETVVVGDLSTINGTKKVAEEANKLGTFDCIIHNAGMYRGNVARNDAGIPALVCLASSPAHGQSAGHRTYP
jgi:NAD(P)-dependent dehydrogenase (short-subunit alcohol dehydrogenase family)